MSFFNYKPSSNSSSTPKGGDNNFRVPSNQVVIEGSNLIKVVDDNPDILEGKTDIGYINSGIWAPCNYNLKTGEINK